MVAAPAAMLFAKADSFLACRENRLMRSGNFGSTLAQPAWLWAILFLDEDVGPAQVGRAGVLFERANLARQAAEVEREVRPCCSPMLLLPIRIDVTEEVLRPVVW